MALDVDQLCDYHGDWTAIEMSLSHWHGTHSPLAYWFAQMSTEDYRKRHIGFRLPMSDVMQGGANLTHGLPTEEALGAVCRQIFANDVAKLTVQILDPNVMQIKKGVRMSFSDKLGVIGNLVEKTLEIYS